MEFQNTPEFAQSLDEQDALKHLRDEFIIPQHNGEDAIYLCGNSLGLQPRGAKALIDKQLFYSIDFFHLSLSRRSQ